MPKDGGNRFSGSFFHRTRAAVCSPTTARTPSRRRRTPLIAIAGTAYDYQINPSFGGPLAKDKVWFYFTYKYQDDKVYVPSAKFPDGSQAYRNSMGNYSGSRTRDVGGTSKDKIRLYIEKQFNGEFFNGFNTYAVTTPEASTDAFGAAGFRRSGGRARSRANCCSRPASPTTTSRYEQNCSRTRPEDRAAATQRLDRPVDRPLRLPDPGVFEHDQGLQHRSRRPATSPVRTR